MEGSCSEWSVSRLKEFLKERGVSYGHCVEKSELVALVEQSSELPLVGAAPIPAAPIESTDLVPFGVSEDYYTSSSSEGMNFYELLGVERDATLNQIKKGYYKQALLWHPDKNHTPGAEIRFKQISEAYQVLQDPALRERYDTYGKRSEERRVGKEC